MGRTDQAPLLGPPAAPPSAIYTDSARRPPRDVTWGWLYAVSLALALAGGVYAAVHRNPNFATLASPDYLADPTHCPAPSAAGHKMRRLLLADGDDPSQYTPTFFLEAAGGGTALSIVGGLLAGLAGLALVKRHPHACVGAAVGLQVALPVAGGIALLAAGAGGGAAPLFLSAALLAGVFYLYREQLALVGRLLSIASAALWDNVRGIIGGSLLLQGAGLLVSLPLLAALLCAFANGGVAPNPAVARIQPPVAGAALNLTSSAAALARGGSGSLPTCLDGSGNEVLCCSWQPDGWAVGFIAWGALVLGWTALLAFTLKVFVVSSITSQWYFAPAGSATKGSLGAALRHAFGPSFGSLALASWLLQLLNMLKSAAQSARSGEGRDNLCVTLLSSCAELLLSVLEAVTKFAVVRCAITGEALLASCRSTSDLLARNMLDSVGVWWFPGMVLQVTALLVSGLWGACVAGGSYLYWGQSKAALSSGLVLGALCFVVAALTLSYLASILLSIVDAVYICFAMDRDASAVTRPEVYQVYVQLPSNKGPPGGVVQQPDGGWAFGATAPPASAPPQAGGFMAPPPHVVVQQGAGYPRGAY